MYLWTPEALVSLLGSPPVLPPAAVLPAHFGPSQISTDTRTLRPGDLFVALDGENFAGASFLAAAKAAGAAAALVAHADLAAAQAANLAALPVANTQAALGVLAQDLRRRIGKPVAGITGSNGKTTSKELLARALTVRGAVHRTAGNLNNAIGVPKTLFDWPDEAWAAVVEMGMNAPGEIAHLAGVAVPDVGLITCVAQAHLQGLGSVENVARAKVELFATLRPEAARIVNADDAVLMAAAAPYLHTGPVWRFGSGAQADVQVVASEDGRVPMPGGEGWGQTVRLRVRGRALVGTLPLVGRHNAHNAAGALAAAMALGVDAQAALGAMAQTVLPHGRQDLVRLAALQVDAMDDGYNANPGSMRAALWTVAGLAQGRRVVAVLGEMRELGPQAEALHEEVGREAARAGVEVLYTLGELGGAMARAAQQVGLQAQAFFSLEALLQALTTTLRPHDWLLVKGSRGMRMERVLQSLRGEPPPTPHP